MIKRYSFLFFISVFWAYSAFAEIICETNFDDVADWTSQDITTSITQDTSIFYDTNIGQCGEETSNAPCWWGYSQGDNSNNIHPPQLYEVNNTRYYGLSGKALHNDIDDSGAAVIGGSLNLWLGGTRTTGYDEIWIAYWFYIPTDHAIASASAFWKNMHFVTGADPDQDSAEINSTYYDGVTKRGNQQYYEIIVDGIGDYRNRLVWFHDGEADYIEHSLTGSSTTFNWTDHLGEWVWVQVHAKRNTFTGSTPNNDAVFEAWTLSAEDIASYNVDSPTIEVDWSGQAQQYLVDDPDRYWTAIVLMGNIDMDPGFTASTHAQNSIDNYVVSTTEIGPTYVIGSTATAPTVNAGSDQNVSVNTATIAGTYTIEDGRTVASCTWSNDQGGSGSLTATGGTISGTVTGLSSGANVITITLTDSEAEDGTDSVVITYSTVTRYYLDADGDGYSSGDYQDAESDPGETWYTEAELTSIVLVDCNDSNAAINPGETEICGNSVDDNCNGHVDEGCGTAVITVSNSGTIITIQTTGTIQVIN